MIFTRTYLKNENAVAISIFVFEIDSKFAAPQIRPNTTR